MPRNNGEIKNQLRRSSLSIPQNISEGYGKFQKRDRARFYDIARGSAHESGAILDICNELNLIEYSRYTR
ncbi:MAG: four helix bundle protein [Halobacteriovoraceae bacterium]|nr:four helix bundle protein [Halobacteriovoraceae bacterium]